MPSKKKRQKKKKHPHFITSFIKEVSIHLLNVTKKPTRARKALAAPDANFLNTKNIYRGAKSSVVGMRLPITLEALGAVE